jgi:hypothetical protein
MGNGVGAALSIFDWVIKDSTAVFQQKGTPIGLTGGDPLYI